MSEAPRRPAVHRSVFGRLVLIMLVMALCLVGLVAGFFRYVVDPEVSGTVNSILRDYERRIAAGSVGREEAQRLSRQMGAQIRYEGPDGAWTTDERLPTIAAMQERRKGWLNPSWGHSHHLVSAPHGGTYLFAWEFGRRTRAAHDKLLGLLLGCMIAVFFTAHFVLNRALRPLRDLQEGVSRLSAGDLDVVLQNRTRDEFGALTDAFNTMAARVKERVRARDQLLRDVSHELRSPLTRLKVALALLPDSAKKVQAEADTAEMEAMITELLELERLREGPPRTTRVDVVALLRETAETYQDGPPGVSVSASPGEIPLDLDVEAMRTVFRNLLGNAVKYSLPDSRAVEVSAAWEGNSLVVRVQDDGPGIPEADLQDVFEPFFRVDRSRSRRTGGYGLGLSICKRIVESHGGHIAATNNPGRGASFTLILPVAHDPGMKS
jgi:signal transduction histidine kinase